MPAPALTRRDFITATSAGLALSLWPRAALGAAKPAATHWPIGCFNRP